MVDSGCVDWKVVFSAEICPEPSGLREIFLLWLKELLFQKEKVHLKPYF